MKKPSILVLEDEQIIALDLKDILEDAGVGEVEIYGESKTALAALEEKTPDAAVLDMNLGGGKTSAEVARALQEKGCPYIFLSGYAEATMKLPDDLRAADRLSKPFDDREVKSAVRSLLT